MVKQAKFDWRNPGDVKVVFLGRMWMLSHGTYIEHEPSDLRPGPPPPKPGPADVGTGAPVIAAPVPHTRARRVCVQCGAKLPAERTKNRRYCSGRCRVAAYRARVTLMSL
jgi:hypothetical protein